MSTFLAFIGGAYLVAALIGAVVPGWNFHVAFADDKSTQKWHARLAEELAVRIKEKEQPHDPR